MPCSTVGRRAAASSPRRSHLHAHKRMGLVATGSAIRRSSRSCPGSAIGHVRYSTAGASVEKNVQPIMVDSFPRLAIAVATTATWSRGAASAQGRELEAYGFRMLCRPPWIRDDDSTCWRWPAPIRLGTIGMTTRPGVRVVKRSSSGWSMRKIWQVALFLRERT